MHRKSGHHRANYLEPRYVIHSYQSSLFITYVERHFSKTREGNANEHSPYKLHISLSENAYRQHAGYITKIITSYLRDTEGSLKEFKIVALSHVKEDIATIKEMTRLLVKYKAILEGKDDKEFDMRHFKSVLLSYYSDYYYKDGFTFPRLDHIDLMINNAKKQFLETGRFIKGDQFTIYIPKKHSYSVLLTLCQKINMYLTSVWAEPGTKLSVASQLGEYISFRQPYLLQDYARNIKCDYVDMTKRIDALSIHETAEQIQRRVAVKAEQDNSELYRKLASDLTPIYSETHNEENASVKPLTETRLKTNNQGLCHSRLFHSTTVKLDERTIFSDYDISKDKFQQYC